jgi:hypothetical protein
MMMRESDFQRTEQEPNFDDQVLFQSDVRGELDVIKEEEEIETNRHTGATANKGLGVKDEP